ncbi:MAG: tetratricopeptide repeat protein [Deltaproteobacteria bacterium]|nr:tetratricopeptide repeat protein [Deltaproteobacteria bacterium]
MAAEMVDHNGAGSSGGQHRILADIAFYLSAARSAFAGSFKYQAEFPDGALYENKGQSLREKAVGKIQNLLLEELVSYLLEEPAFASLEYSRGQLRDLAGQVLKIEILEEKKIEQDYYLKARMVGDVDSLKEDKKTLEELEEKVRALEMARKRAAEANEDIQKLKKEIEMVKTRILLAGGTIEEKPEEDRAIFDVIEKGDALYAQEDLDGAIQAYGQALELNPTSAVALMNRGAAFLKKGDVDRAMEDFDRVLELESENPLSYVNRGCAFALQEEWEAALKDFSRAIELAPDTGDAYLNRAIAYLKQGIDYEAAEKDLTLYIGMHAGDYRGHLYRAIALSYMEQYDTALREYEEAIQLNPSEISAYYNRGNTYLKVGDVASALDDYTRVITMNGVEGDVYYNRGIAYVRIGEMEKALDDFTRSIESYPLDAETYLRRGWIHARLGNESLAIRDWEHAQSLGNETAAKYLERYGRTS